MKDKVVEWREQSFKNLDYEPTAARILAYTRDRHGVWLYHEDVKKALDVLATKGVDAGEARAIVFRIFADDVDLPDREDDDAA